MTTRWMDDPGVERGAGYDRKWVERAAAGASIHGEADLVCRLLTGLDPPVAAGTPARVLDAGCGTGRVAIELAARGHAVHGVDLDPAMLATARAKAPQLPWTRADLADLDLPDATSAAGPAPAGFDLAVLAGNVLLFVAPGTEAAVVAALARHIRPGGLLVAGFQLGPGRLTVAAHDAHAAAAGLEPAARWSTWEGDPFTGSDYVVAVHRRPAPPRSAPAGSPWEDRPMHDPSTDA